MSGLLGMTSNTGNRVKPGLWVVTYYLIIRTLLKKVRRRPLPFPGFTTIALLAVLMHQIEKMFPGSTGPQLAQYDCELVPYPLHGRHCGSPDGLRVSADSVHPRHSADAACESHLLGLQMSVGDF